MNTINIVAVCFLLLSCRQAGQTGDFKFGADVLLEENMNLLAGKDIGIITNRTGILSNGELLLDSLLKLQDKFNIAAVFSPEHGFDLSILRGKEVPKTRYGEDLEIHSLYGQNLKPIIGMLKNIDILIFDMQDIGARFYTYISTLYKIIETSAENDIPLIVLDRPNPLGGLYVDGPVLDENYKSFVGISEIPVAHGMTIGELALLFNDEIRGSGKRADPTVIKMKNWERSYNWSDLNLPWNNTSPNIINFETALLYPATCYLEGTNISEGRGTYLPFTLIGAPFIDADKLKSELQKFGHKNIELRDVEFVPVDIEDKAIDPKFENKICQGIQIIILNVKTFEPVKFGVELLCTLQKLYPGKFEITSYFDKLWGTDEIRNRIIKGDSPEEIYKSWKEELELFKNYRKQFLLY